MKHYFLTAAIILLTTVGLLFYDKDSPDAPPVPIKAEMDFVRSVNIGDNMYVSVFKDMNVGSFSTDNALVMPEGAFSFVYKGRVYITDTKHIRKYVQKKGKLVREGNTILLPSGAAAMYITFASDHKAYVSCHGLGRVIIIDPTTMKKAGEIDLAEYSLGKAAGDNNPKPATSVIRDEMLCVALSQMKSTYVCETGTYTALIDTKTGKPIKVVSNSRISMTSGESPAGDPFISEKDDIYFYCVATFGYQLNAKEGFLHVKKGQTGFDKSYCFTLVDVNLVGVKGNKTSYAHVKVYGDSGKVYAYLNIPGAASNPPDYIRDKCFQPFEINLYSESYIRLDLSATARRAATLCKSDNNITFGMSTNQGMDYSVYHPTTATHEILKVKASDAPYAMHELR